MSGGREHVIRLFELAQAREEPFDLVDDRILVTETQLGLALVEASDMSDSADVSEGADCGVARSHMRREKRRRTRSHRHGVGPPVARGFGYQSAGRIDGHVGRPPPDVSCQPRRAGGAGPPDHLSEFEIWLAFTFSSPPGRYPLYIQASLRTISRRVFPLS